MPSGADLVRTGKIARGSTTAALKIAHKMLSKQGITIEEISDFTGISIEELRKLKDKQH